MPAIPFTDKRNEPSGPRGSTPQGYRSQGTIVTSSPQMLNASPFMLSDSATARLVAPQLRARGMNAPQVTAPRYTAEQNRDILGPALADAGEAIGKAAIVMADKQATLEASEATNAFNQTARNLWLGSPDGRGGFTPGYAATTTKDAAQGYPDFQASLDQTRIEMANNLGDSARAKFFAASNGQYTNYLNQAAQHAQSGQIAWEKQEIAKSWTATYQRVDDYLSVGDAQGAIAAIDDTVTQMSQSVHVSPVNMAEAQQEVMRKMADYMATKEDSSGKISALQAMLENRFDLDTATYYSKAIQSAVLAENRLADSALAREERDLRIQKEKNEIQLYLDVKKGNAVDWNSVDALVATGRISASFVDTMQQREQTKFYYGAIPAAEEIAIKQNIDDYTMEQILALPYNDASVDEVSSYKLNMQNANFRNSVTYGNSRIQATFKTRLKGYSNQDLELAVTQAQRDFAKLIVGPDAKKPAEALQQVEQAYLANYVPTVSPMIVMPGGGIIDLNTIPPYDAARQVEQAELNGDLTESEATALYNQIEAFEQRGASQ